MMDLIINNIGTVVTAIVVLGIVTAIVAGLAARKRRGKPLLCDSCDNCAGNCFCHGCKNNEIIIIDHITE
ncbi:hypothetical protein FACS1894127_7740 [Clostridia bacterium]|nr:hypothetical protein FACS1894127_7740 [Clostridia bacterium]